MRFTKMQGLGNDYIYVSLFSEKVPDPAGLSVQMAKPHFGVGSDGLVLIGPSEKADFSMRMFNADGSEGEMCGNAARCVGKYVCDKGLTTRDAVTLETNFGVRTLLMKKENGRVRSVSVDMGKPVLDPGRIPVNAETNTVQIPLREGTLTAFCVNPGNPHAVIFVDDPAAVPLQTLGPEIEHHPLFPRRTNVEFVRVDSPTHLTMRVWERGSGETMACGTGACACLIAAAVTGRIGREATISLPGGDLLVRWDPDGHVWQTGPAVFVFDGDWPDEEA